VERKIEAFRRDRESERSFIEWMNGLLGLTR
jgi:hypothetical protein